MYLDHYIEIDATEDPPLGEKVREVLAKIADTPEGKEKLEQALALHGKPIKIVVSHAIPMCFYTDIEGLHSIYFNSEMLKLTTLKSSNGEKIANTLERFFCHEIFHGTQPGIHEEAMPYFQEKAEIEMAMLANVPLEKCAHVIGISKNMEELKRNLGRFFDEYIGLHTQEMYQTRLRRFNESAIIRDFVDKYEVPAIEFENAMATKYYGQKERNTDYINSDFVAETSIEDERKGFIDGTINSVRENLKHADPEQLQAFDHRFR